MSDIILDINAGRERGTPQPLDETPFRIALLGDFSGRESRGITEVGATLAARRTWRVDRDDLDEALEEMAPSVQLRLEPDGPPLRLRFAALEDFHPDRLFERLPVFQALRDLRRRLSDPATFHAAARELSGESPPPAPRRPPSGGSLLADILDQASPPDAAEALAEAGGDLHAFIQRVLRPHLVPNPDPRQGELVAQVDAAASATLRAILHATEFQALEALWRAADLLVRRVETSPDLQVHLIDLSEPELIAALPLGGDPTTSPLYQLLARHSGTAPWALLAGAYRFGAAPADIDRLAQLAAIGHLLGAPWIGAADPRLAGAPDVAALAEPAAWQAAPDPRWEAFRSLSLARSVGLVLPGFLLRLPYGRAFEECEQVRFEEHEKDAGLAAYLWGPPAFAVALILGRAFAEAGWRLTEEIDPEIGGLPFVVIGPPADHRTIPVGQVLLTVTAADRLMDRGLMPLATMKDSDRVRLVRLQSLANPLAALAGRWSNG